MAGLGTGYWVSIPKCRSERGMTGWVRSSFAALGDKPTSGSLGIDLATSASAKQIPPVRDVGVRVQQPVQRCHLTGSICGGHTVGFDNVTRLATVHLNAQANVHRSVPLHGRRGRDGGGRGRKVEGHSSNRWGVRESWILIINAFSVNTDPLHVGGMRPDIGQKQLSD